MKKTLLTLASLSIGFAAQAGDTVCKGKSLKYSLLLTDFGTRPPQGMKTGSLTITLKGKTLVKRVYYAGTGHYTIDPYDVELTETQLISSTGNRIHGSSMSKDIAILYKVNTLVPNQKAAIHSEEVICKKTWAMRP